MRQFYFRFSGRHHEFREDGGIVHSQDLSFFSGRSHIVHETDT
jgi:hypothetical protein